MVTLRMNFIGWSLGMSLAAACTAAAAGPAADTAKQGGPEQTGPATSGLMSFPNVRVVNPPVAAAKPAVDKSAPGMRAYIDPQTKQLRPQTPEEALQESKAATQARASARSTQSAAADTGGTLIYGPGTTVGMTLGEDTMVFEVAHKQSQGAPALECVTGKAAAEQALTHTAIGASHTAEVHDER